jgi:hypothetical protein
MKLCYKYDKEIFWFPRLPGSRHALYLSLQGEKEIFLSYTSLGVPINDTLQWLTLQCNAPALSIPGTHSANGLPVLRTDSTSVGSESL